jgi:hypothetical protein
MLCGAGIVRVGDDDGDDRLDRRHLLAIFGVVERKADETRVLEMAVRTILLAVSHLHRVVVILVAVIKQAHDAIGLTALYLDDVANLELDSHARLPSLCGFGEGRHHGASDQLDLAVDLLLAERGPHRVELVAGLRAVRDGAVDAAGGGARIVYSAGISGIF